MNWTGFMLEPLSSFRKYNTNIIHKKPGLVNRLGIWILIEANCSIRRQALKWKYVQSGQCLLNFFDSIISFFLMVIKLWILSVYTNCRFYLCIDGHTCTKPNTHVCIILCKIICNSNLILKTIIATKIGWNISICIKHLSFIITSYGLRVKTVELGSSITSGITASTASKDQKAHKNKVN